MAKKIAITLRKGGAGKTTTAVNLATGLYLTGKRVLLIDLDPQANATVSVGLDPMALSKNINTLFVDADSRPVEAIIKTGYGLDVLPSHPGLARTEASMMATQIGILKEIIEPFEASYDFIIVDTPPSESFLSINALAAADEIIIPLQAHFLALQGLNQMFEQVRQIKKGLNPKLKIAGILPTLVSSRTNIGRNVIDEIRQNYPDLLYPFQIDYSIKHAEASLAGVPIVKYAPKHPGALAYWRLVERVLL